MRLLHVDEHWNKSREIGVDEIVVASTRDDLLILAGAINEALAAIDDWEFSIRLGGTKEQARALRAEIGQLLEDTFRPE
jgi:hypothetical protein